jgi:hypothetical protein
MQDFNIQCNVEIDAQPLLKYDEQSNIDDADVNKEITTSHDISESMAQSS